MNDKELMVKRKFAFEEQEEQEVKEAKMLKMNGSNTVSKVGESGRDFEFNLTEKTAKSNLLKAANRKIFEIERKQKCTILYFSAGSYLFTVMPFLRHCEEKLQREINIMENNVIIQVCEYQDGKDMAARHIDSKIVLNVNKEKIVLHSYNSTQKVMVSGSKYLEFTENFLKPLFMREVEKAKDAIIEYDESVKKSLTPSHGPRFATSRSVKSIRSAINQQSFQCTKCDVTTKSYGSLKKHKVIAHSASLNASENNMLYLRHSTRNNSIQEEPLLCEDISLGAIRLPQKMIWEPTMFLGLERTFKICSA